MHVVIPDITRAHFAVNIRKFLPARRSLDDLVRAGSLPLDVADLLRDAMTGGRNVLVSGATHAGKTTLLAALIGACAPEQRIITVEETFELAVTAPDIVALQGRQPSLEGTSGLCCISCNCAGWRMIVDLARKRSRASLLMMVGRRLEPGSLRSRSAVRGQR